MFYPYYQEVLDHMPKFRDDNPPDDGDDITLLSERTRTAKVEHLCCYCKRPILIGQRYHRAVYIDSDNKFHCDYSHGLAGCVDSYE